MEDLLPFNRTKFWNAINRYTKLCGGDPNKAQGKRTNKKIASSISAVEEVIYEFEKHAREHVRRVSKENDEMRRRVAEKDDILQSIGRASAYLKNTAQGDVLLLPGNLEVTVTEGIKK